MHELVEITRPGHRKDRPILLRIEVPTLGLKFLRPDSRDAEILVYKGDTLVREISLYNNSASEFRRVARNYARENS